MSERQRSERIFGRLPGLLEERQTDRELEMPKTRREEGGLGDWSSTGTFLRKPSSGWLHDDHELQDQSSINYKIKVSPSLCLSSAAPVGADPPVDQCKQEQTLATKTVVQSLLSTSFWNRYISTSFIQYKLDCDRVCTVVFVHSCNRFLDKVSVKTVSTCVTKQEGCIL